MENIYGILTLYTDCWSHRPVDNNKDILLKYSGLSSVYFPKEILIGNRATKDVLILLLSLGEILLLTFILTPIFYTLFCN